MKKKIWSIRTWTMVDLVADWLMIWSKFIWTFFRSLTIFYQKIHIYFSWAMSPMCNNVPNVQHFFGEFRCCTLGASSVVDPESQSEIVLIKNDPGPSQSKMKNEFESFSEYFILEFTPDWSVSVHGSLPASRIFDLILPLFTLMILFNFRLCFKNCVFAVFLSKITKNNF